MYLLNGSVLTADSMTLMVVSFSQLLRVLAVSVGTVLHGYTSLLYENESLRVEVHTRCMMSVMSRHHRVNKQLLLLRVSFKAQGLEPRIAVAMPCTAMSLVAKGQHLHSVPTNL